MLEGEFLESKRKNQKVQRGVLGTIKGDQEVKIGKFLESQRRPRSTERGVHGTKKGTRKGNKEISSNQKGDQERVK